MLENDRPATPDVVKHIDRCLSCLACMTTCPSGVHYMASRRSRDAVGSRKPYDRPLADRLVRSLLAAVLPHPGLFPPGARRCLVRAAAWRVSCRRVLPPLLRLAPSRLPAPSPVDRPQVFPAEGERVRRVALLAAAPSGCWRLRSTRRRFRPLDAAWLRGRRRRRRPAAAAPSSTISARRRRPSPRRAPNSMPGRR